MTAKKGATAHDRRASQAVEAFEKAVKALGKKDFDKARDLFDEIIAAHPDERDVVERARTYRALCERALDRRPAFKPKTLEEMLNYGVFLHNKGEYQEALKYLQQAAELHPKNEHALYCLAAAAARAGDTATAIQSLRSAIAVSTASRAQARSDADFDPIRDEDEFVDLVYASGS